MEEQHLQRKANGILIITIILSMIGILMVFSTSSIIVEDKGRGMYLFAKQSCWFLLGILSIFFIMKRSLKWWTKSSGWFFLIFLGLLLLTLAVPTEKEVKRWILGIQPSEFVRVFYIFSLAKFFSKERRTIIPPCIFLGVIVCSLVFQPHRGMAIFFCILSLFIFILAKVKKWYMFFVFLFSFVIMGIIIASGGYSIERVKNWLYKEGDRWQVEQAKIALGAGGMFGVGFGKSMQKLSCVPISHSDFIFAILGEEGGFIASFILFVLFALFAYFGFSIAWHSSSLLGFFLAFSLTFSIISQAMINIAIVSDVIPTAGLSLPFISYGGSSLLSNFIAVGFIMNVAREG